MKVQLLVGDCRERLLELEDESIDSVVTDPPYELGFMGKGWDNAGVSFDPETWKAVYRVLKPGGHLLAFGGTRTFHRITVAIEDAGFEIRDCVAWMYGSGFPKSMDVSKAIDKAAKGHPQGSSDPTSPNHGKYRTQKTEGKRHEGDKGKGFGAGPGQFMREPGTTREANLVSEAEQWQGWGTALKPAYEPIIVARKPLIGTVAQNVLEHGTGALNIDATRIGTTGATTRSEQTPYPNEGIKGSVHATRGYRTGHEIVSVNAGRWPANMILSHDEDCEFVGTKKVGKGKTGKAKFSQPNIRGDNFNRAKGRQQREGMSYGEQEVEDYRCVPDCPVRLLDEQTGTLKSGKPAGGSGPHKAKKSVGKGGGASLEGAADGSLRKEGVEYHLYGDSGGASRFFYTAKVAKKERQLGLPEGMVNNHPTIKPVKLMQYLVRLVTPPNGIVLDPFMGSGTTGMACVKEKFNFVGVELDREYKQIASYRIRHAMEERKTEMGKRQRNRDRLAGTRKTPNESRKEFEKRVPQKKTRRRKK